MVWNALLWHSHWPNGNGQPQWCKTFLPMKSTIFRVMFVWYHYVLLTSLCFVVYFFFQRKYAQHYEDTKDQIYFMQTDTPVYEANKKARIAASEVSTQTNQTNTQRYQIFLYVRSHAAQQKVNCMREAFEPPLTQELDVCAHTAWLSQHRFNILF